MEYPKKVLIITNIPNPYRIPLFNELNEQLKKNGIHLKIVFGAEGYSRRKWRIDLSACSFDYDVLKSRTISIRDQEKTLFTFRGLLKLVRSENPDIIVTPGFSLATIKLWLRSWFKPTRYIIWSGSIQKKGRYDSKLRIWLRRTLVKRASGFVVYGSKAKEYLMSLGAAEESVQIAINTVDTKFYEERVAELREQALPEDTRHHLLFIGHLSPRKNVSKLLRVIKALSEIRVDFILDIVGDGEDRDLLEEFVKTNGLEKLVEFHGFKQKHEIPEFLARAELFLFQTDFDIWGLVLNEAMASGVPCLASIHAGATHDLIIDGENGYAIDFAYHRHIAETVDSLLCQPDKLKRFSDEGKLFIGKYATLNHSINGFLSAINNYVQKKV